jgi:hypothetical protein
VKAASLVLLGWIALQSAGCGDRAIARGGQTTGDSLQSRPSPADDGGADPDLRSGPDSVLDERILAGTVEQRIAIYVEASMSELEEERRRVSEEDFGVIADDLMYRSTATRYLETQPYPLVRISGRRPIRFLVAGTPRLIEFADLQLLDYIILYDRNREPVVIAPNEAERAAEYFGRDSP